VQAERTPPSENLSQSIQKLVQQKTKITKITKPVPSNSHEEYMLALTAKLSYSAGLADTMYGTLMKDLPLAVPPGIKRVQVLFL